MPCVGEGLFVQKNTRGGGGGGGCSSILYIALSPSRELQLYILFLNGLSADDIYVTAWD